MVIIEKCGMLSETTLVERKKSLLVDKTARLFLQAREQQMVGRTLPILSGQVLKWSGTS